MIPKFVTILNKFYIKRKLLKSVLFLMCIIIEENVIFMLINFNKKLKKNIFL